MTRVLQNNVGPLAWDADGVLLDSWQVAATAYEDIAALFGARPTIRCAQDRIAAWRAVKQAEATEPDGTSILSALHRILMRDRAGVVLLFDAVIEIVEQLKIRPPLITAAYAAGVRQVLGPRANLFQSIRGCEEGPKDGLISKAADAGVRWYVTDTIKDVERCRQAGIRSIGVAWGYDGPVRLAAAEPDLIVRTPQELAAALAELGFLNPKPDHNPQEGYPQP